MMQKKMRRNDNLGEKRKKIRNEKKKNKRKINNTVSYRV